MSSKSAPRFLKSTTLRLTLWYLAIFSSLSLVVFAVVYIFLVSHLHDQIDHELIDSGKEFATLYAESGSQALQAEFSREAASRGTKRVFFTLISAPGKILASSALQTWNKSINLSLKATDLFSKQPTFRTISRPDHPHKVRVITMPCADGNIIKIGISLEGEEHLLERYRETFGTALTIMLICGGLMGWFMARKAMAGVKRVTETATRIGLQDNFSQRVAVIADEGEEIITLVQAFNEMLKRIELLLNELQQITDNIAHELRTPITRIRGIAETTLKGDATLDEYREMAALVIEGSDDLVVMVNTMLEIAKAGSEISKRTLEPLDFNEITKEAVELFAPLAEDQEITLNLKLSTRPLTVTGERSKLQRVISNLLDNAIKYTPAHGTIEVTIKSNKSSIILQIADSGRGINAEDLPNIFDRFYRTDKSRSTTGSGLGLSLAQSIIQAHSGKINVTSTQTGTTFTVTLPI